MIIMHRKSPIPRLLGSLEIGGGYVLTSQVVFGLHVIHIPHLE